jgi:hypothetical protein
LQQENHHDDHVQPALNVGRLVTRTPIKSNQFERNPRF